LRVVIAHNFYRSTVPSGENAVVESEADALEGSGIEVARWFRSSDDIGARTLSAATGPLYSRGAVRELKALASQRPVDILHVHNVFPLLGPSLMRAAKRLNIAVIHTHHNYRRTCIAGTHYRDGDICTDCLGTRWPLPGVIHGCYRASRPQSALFSVSQVAHASTWLGIDQHIVLTHFMKDSLIRAGFAEQRISVRPTSFPDPGPTGSPANNVLFVGRLDEAKGLPLLLQAWQRANLSARGWSLAIAGDGPLRSLVTAAAAADESIQYFGPLGADVLADAYATAAVVAVPSQWYEGYPRVIAEAFGHSRPILASSIGSLGEIVLRSGAGWAVEPGVQHWTAALQALPEADFATVAHRARAAWESELEPTVGLRSLIAIYQSALAYRGQVSRL
jgi:glycosyltransferase involved in cell wall biosynthesis